jgi:Protein of unknown function (DUF3352)
VLHRWSFPSACLAAAFALTPYAPAVAQSRSIADLPPENSPFVLIVDTQAQTWQDMKRFELFAKLEANSQQTFHPGSLLFSPMHLDYAADVQPWIGDEAALVLLPMARARDVNPSERTLLVASVANAEAFAPMLDVLAETKQVEPQEMSYKGVPIWVWEAQEELLEPMTEPCDDLSLCEPWFDPYAETLPNNNHLFDQPFWYLDTARQNLSPRAYESEFEIILKSGSNQSETYISEPGLVIARLNDHVVLAENLETLKLWIEHQQSDGPRLSDNSTFVAAQNDMSDQAKAVAQMYGDVGELSHYSFDLPLAGLPFLATLPDENLLEQAAALRALEDIRFQGVLYPQSEGLRLTTKLYGNALTQGALAPTSAPTGSILTHLPANTYFLFSGQNLGGLWQTLANTFSLDEIATNWLENARSMLGTETEADLNIDALAWMDGEYSLFFIPSQAGLINTWLPGAGIEIGFVVQTRDRNAADTTLNALDTWIGTSLIENNQLHNHPVVNWRYDPDADSTTTHDQTQLLTRTWLTDDTLAITTGTGAMTRLLNPVGFAPLTQHSTFTKATDSLPRPNYGYGYVNMAPTLAMLYQAMGWNYTASGGYEDPYMTEIKGLLGSFYSLSFTTSSLEGVWQADVLVGLAPGED